MVISTTYIPKEIEAKIKEAADLLSVIGDFTTLKKEGSSLVGECPYCHTKRFTVSPSKQIYKCYAGCEKGGKYPTQFLTDVMGKTYPEALVYLADKYSISIEQPVANHSPASGAKEKFRDIQLRNSGIWDKKQKWKLSETEGTEREMDRFQAATIDKFWNVIPGDDMVLHYLDLDGKPLMYKPTKGQQRALIRVRWANPSLHLDKSGKPIKYQSPADSGSHLWFPNPIIKSYKASEPIETLVICEGEKKADALNQVGIPAVAVMGIHNLSNSEMPMQFELLIKRCEIKNVVFLLDSDWQDLSIKDGMPVDQRPKTFYKAVLNFRRYFYAYHNSGIYLSIFFAHGKDAVHKGIDDVLVYELKGKEKELVEDFQTTRISRDGEGAYINMYNITETSDYQLREYWHLHSTPAFLKKHKDQLKELREFKINKLKRRYNPETDEFELAQKFLPREQYWKVTEWVDRNGQTRTKYEFNYRNLRHFLYNRGYGLYEYTQDQYRFVLIDGMVVSETTTQKIHKYVIDFTEEIKEYNVLELLLRGGRTYLGSDKLMNIYHRNFEWNESTRHSMFLYFKNCYWKITEDEIIQRPLAELPRYVWKDKIIDFEPKSIGNMLGVSRSDDKWVIKSTTHFNKSDIAQFYLRTSFFSWSKKQEVIKDEQGKKIIVDKEKPEKMAIEDVDTMTTHLVSKMLAAGYVLHDYLDYGLMKAVVCMDGMESEVGKSQGGTGKSIWGKQFEHLVPIEVIDGKKKNIEDDNHIYENVDERTAVIVYDDVRVNFNFEHLFSQITTAVEVNPKGIKRRKLPPKKFVVITNHALNGEGNSYDRRQYQISFSDYYNQHRTVGQDFGHQLFHEWDYDQWNLFYNWLATCVQTYLKYGLKYGIPSAALKRRKIRQRIGENFLSWASLVFDTDKDEMGEPYGIFLNKKVEKTYLCHRYIEQYPADRKYMSPKRMKEKIQLYAKYAGLLYNPGASDSKGRIKSNSKEYFILGDKDFDEANMGKIAINNDEDLKRSNTPFA